MLRLNKEKSNFAFVHLFGFILRYIYHHGRSKLLLSMTVLVSSACGLVIEIVAGRLLAPIFGMSFTRGHQLLPWYLQASRLATGLAAI